MKHRACEIIELLAKGVEEALFPDSLANRVTFHDYLMTPHL